MGTLQQGRIKQFGKTKLSILRDILPSLYSVDIAAPIKTKTITMSKDRPRINALLKEKIDQDVLTATNSSVIIKAYQMLIKKNTAEHKLLASEVHASADILSAAAHTLAREKASLIEVSCEDKGTKKE